MTAILDLGALEPPLLFFGGAYGNLQATESLRAEAARRGVSPDRVICTGDVVAYCGAPAESVALIRDWGIAVTQGNVEEQIAAAAEDCGCGFEEGSACEVLSRSWYALCLAALDPATARWMERLPRLIRFEVDGVRFAVLHAAADAINRFVFASTPAADKQAQLDALGVDAVIAGHSGIPFTQRLDGGVWHNAGVVGMPANDGTPEVWFSMLARTGAGLAFVHHRLDYDFAAAAADMRRGGFPEPYARALETGLWPSLDILPDKERAETGVRLSPGGVVFQTPAHVLCEAG
jgi:predicted phosphodiesterase